MADAENQQIELFAVDEHGRCRFEELARENGTRFWYARDYMLALGYSDWGSFKSKVLNRAMGACALLNIAIDEGFERCERRINGRKVEDFKLNRFACCMIAINGDPKKTVVAEAQAYFSSLAIWVRGEAFAAESADRIVVVKRFPSVNLLLTRQRQDVVLHLFRISRTRVIVACTTWIFGT